MLDQYFNMPNVYVLVPGKELCQRFQPMLFLLEYIWSALDRNLPYANSRTTHVHCQYFGGFRNVQIRKKRWILLYFEGFLYLLNFQIVTYFAYIFFLLSTRTKLMNTCIDIHFHKVDFYPMQMTKWR